MKSRSKILKLSTISVGICLFVVSIIGDLFYGKKANPPLILIAIASLLCLIFITLLWVDFPARFRRQRDTFSLFGPDALCGNLTLVGWVAASRDWIASIDDSGFFRRLDHDDIGNIYWDIGPDDIHSIGSDPVPEAYYTLFESDDLRNWIVIEAEDDLSKSILLIFQTQSTRNRWLEVAKSIKLETWPSNEAGLRLPSKTTFLKNALNRERLRYMFGALILFTLMFHYPGYVLVTTVLKLLFFVSLFPIDYPVRKIRASIGSIRLERYWFGMNASLNGGLSTVLLDGRLFIYPLDKDREDLRSISLSEIANVELQSFVPPWTERPVFQWWSRRPSTVLLRLSVRLRDEKQSKLNLLLPVEQAKALHQEIQTSLTSRPA